MPYPNFIGSRPFWTREKVIAALSKAMTEIRGPLPCFDREYSRLKKGRLDWPTSGRVLKLFGSMARGWLAAGANKNRVTLNNIAWTDEETEYLLEHAGEKKLKDIAFYLRRSYNAVRARLGKTHKIRARDNQGFISAAQLSKELHCSCHRLRSLLAEGFIKGAWFDKTRNAWRINPTRIAPEVRRVLTAERRTHKTWPMDCGDYYQRHGLIRKNGKAIKETVIHEECERRKP